MKFYHFYIFFIVPQRCQMHLGTIQIQMNLMEHKLKEILHLNLFPSMR